jgi:hypothetical protein
MEEKPFDSLARGLDRDLSSLMDTTDVGERKRVLRTPFARAFGVSDLALGIGTPSKTVFAAQPFHSLSDKFAKQIAVYPLGNHVVINEFGAFIPQSIFGNQTDITYKEEKLPDGAIRITVRAKKSPTHLLKRPEFGSARGLIKIAEDFDEPLRRDDPIFDIGREPIACGISDASENLDKYLYGGE